HPAALHFQEYVTQLTEPCVYASYIQFAGTKYDAAWVAVLADLNKSVLSGDCEIRAQNKGEGTIQFARPVDKERSAFLTYDIRFSKTARDTPLPKTQMDVTLTILRQTAIAKSDIIKEFARLMDIATTAPVTSAPTTVPIQK
ncbi:MAG: hypothetical protein WCS01_11930, partial [bacterium]